MRFGLLGRPKRVERNVSIFEADETFVEVDAASLALHRPQSGKVYVAGNAHLRLDAGRRNATATVRRCKARAGRKTRQRDAAGDDALRLTQSAAWIDGDAFVNEAPVALDARV